MPLGGTSRALVSSADRPLSLLAPPRGCQRPPANETRQASGSAEVRGRAVTPSPTPPAASPLPARPPSLMRLPLLPAPPQPSRCIAMVTTRHAAAEQAAAGERVASDRRTTAQEQLQLEQDEAEMRERQRKAAEQRAELRQRRRQRAEGKRAREEHWVEHCNRQNQHIAEMWEGEWEAPPPRPLPPPAGDPPVKKRKPVGWGGWRRGSRWHLPLWLVK